MLFLERQNYKKICNFAIKKSKVVTRVIITAKTSKLMSRIPHKILINGNFIGIMQQKQVSIDMPAGMFQFSIQSVIPYFSSSTIINVQENVENHLVFQDREKWWDILLIIDLILWTWRFFWKFPSPWNWIYEVFTNGILILWLLYEWLIRKKYFKISTYIIPTEGKVEANISTQGAM